MCVTLSGAGDGSLTATVTSTYDNLGNLLTIDGPLSGSSDTTRFRYDAARQVVGVVGPDPDGGGSLKHRAIRTTYNADGQATMVEQGTVDSQSDGDWAAFSSLQQANTTYNSIGSPILQTLTASSATHAAVQMSYDNANRLDCTALRMNPAIFGSLPSSACSLGTEGSYGPDRIARTFYNNANQVIRVATAYATAAQIDESETSYGPTGLPATPEDAGGNLTTFEYDGFDRLRKIRFPNASGGGSSTSDYEQYTYDAASNVTQTRRRDGATLSYTFDYLNRVTLMDASSNGDDVSYSYDNFGRMLTSAISGHTVTFTYDQLSRNLSQQSPLGTVSYQYDIAGRRTRVTWPDSFWVQYDYDLDDAVTAIREYGASSGAGVLSTYAYDNLGRRTGVTRGNGTTETATFDAASRLTALAQDLSGTSSDQTLTLGYNAATQIVSRQNSNTIYQWSSQSPGTTAYSDNGLNQYTSVGGTSQSYDSRGNLTTGGYGYDIFNRLVSGPNSAALSYDPLGRLYQAQNASIAATRFLYDDEQVIAEYNTSGTLLRRYVPGPGIDEPIVWYEGSGTSDRRWLVADQLGSITAVTNGSGAATNINTYDEYGLQGSSNTGRFQFTGQMWLPEIGVYHYRARAYSPALGRFLQADPILYDGGMNLYAYVGNDPVNFVDPLGLEETVVATGRRRATEGVGALAPGVLRVGGGGPDVVLARMLMDEVQTTATPATDAEDEIVVLGCLTIACQQNNNSAFLRSVSSRRWREASSAYFKYVILSGAGGVLFSHAIRYGLYSLRAGQALRAAAPVGSALEKADTYHRAATFMRVQASRYGQHFRITWSRTGEVQTLTQIRGSLNGVAGRFEYIVDARGRLVHQMFVPSGRINGIPIVR